MPPQTLPKRYLIRIELIGVHLPIWRELIVPSDVNLGDFDQVIQATMGWSEEQIHLFIMNGVRYQSADAQGGDGENPEELVDLDQLLNKVGDSMQYVYDMDDGWTHTITLKEVLPWDENKFLVCTDGSGACPLEDNGGALGYEKTCRSGEIRFPEVFEPKRANLELVDLLEYFQTEEGFAEGVFDEEEDLQFADLLGADDDDDEGGGQEAMPHPYLDLSQSDQLEFRLLLDAGVAVRAAEPWKDLWDQDVFCVKDPETGLLDFVSVLGRAGEVFAVHVHRAPECYTYWQSTKEGTLVMDSIEDFLRGVRMGELEFVNKSEMESEDLDLYEALGYKKPSRGQQKWMRVRRYHPRSIPHFPSAEILPSLIRGAQLAVRFVAAVRAEPNRARSKWIESGEKSAGVPVELPVFTLAENRDVNDWAAWELENHEVDWSPEGLTDGSYDVSEFAQERVGLLPKSSGPWEVGAIYSDKPFATQSGPVIAIIAMAAPTFADGEPPEPYISGELEESLGKCVWQAFAETAVRRGERPDQLNVMTDVAEKTFRPFADKYGMKLKRVEKPELIHTFFRMMKDSL